jgi:hypothetical protein
VKSYLLLLALGLALIAGAGAFGGKPAAIGGAVALASQLWAVALLRPVMRAPNPAFMARWLGGMGIRLLALGGLLAWSATHRDALPPLATAGGFLGVLLPLLFFETRFLR